MFYVILGLILLICITETGAMTCLKHWWRNVFLSIRSSFIFYGLFFIT